ncbi:MAG: ATP-dependent zinc metalloprotease FtsH [Planctomycetaceae bacterium]|nr:ATP-dependent zinc metalloprotease FtsH [Planctomycetaceae bacterium]
MSEPSTPLPSSRQSSGFPQPMPRNLLFFIILGGLILFALFLSSNHSSGGTRKLSWGEFRQELDAGNIVSVNAVGTSLTGKFSCPDSKSKSKSNNPDKMTVVNFSTEIPLTALADQEIEQQIYLKLGKNYNASPVPDVLGTLMIVSMIASVGIVIAFVFMFRRTRDQILSGAGSGMLGFGRSPARRYNNNANRPTTFEDVAGLDSIKNELLEIVDYLQDPQKYQRMGARVPKGTLLVGPPGTGKTLLGRAVAGEAGVPFFSINGSEFIQMFAGVGASRVRDLFQTAKESAPAILFIDEIDAVGRHRGTGIGAGHDEREQTLNQILSEMDGFTPSESVMVMAATNRPDVLDPALLRPGRFDRHITVDRPTLKGREAIFRVHIRNIPLASDVDMNVLARRTVGFTGADIRNLVNEATLWATRNGKNEVEKADFDYAQDKVVMGLRREEVITPEERKKVAYHEAGHTVVGWFQPLSSPVHKVSIVPRGRSLGATYTLPEGDPIGLSAKQAHAQLAFAMGGRAAERLVFDELPAGVENDLKQATKLARRMVSNWGMSEKLGPVAFNVDETHPFLGREINSNREFSEEIAKLIDEEVCRFLADADTLAAQLLRDNRTLLDQLAAALEAEEEIDEPRLIEILGTSPFKTNAIPTEQNS